MYSKRAMRIRWVVSAASVTPISSELSSDLASYRYRAAIPMRELRARGHACDWHALRAGETVDDRHPLLDTDVLVIAKNHSEPAEVIALLDRARTAGIATVVDTCDDYFADTEPLAPYYRALVERADVVTTSSFQLAGSVEDATGAHACVVRDPYEGPEGVPRWSPTDGRVHALWFGTPLNLPALLDEAMALPRIEGCRLDIVALTRRCDGLEEAFEKLSARAPDRLTLAFREWSLERNWSALRDCDCVVIPVKEGDRFSLAKGPNRLVEALRAGRYAFTGGLPAYEELRPYASVGEDIGCAITGALRHPDEVLQCIAAGQRYVEQHYSPPAVAAEWENALRTAIASRRAPGSA
jgi:hypothetical protein